MIEYQNKEESAGLFRGFDYVDGVLNPYRFEDNDTEGAISDWGMCDGKTTLKLKEPMDINATLMCNPFKVWRVTMKAVVTLEIEIKDDIEKLYNNFIFNYDSKKDFLINQIASLNHNISIDEQMVYKNLHPSFENPNYKFYDDGYKQTVTKVEIL